MTTRKIVSAKQTANLEYQENLVRNNWAMQETKGLERNALEILQRRNKKTCVDKLGNFQSSMNEFSKKNNIYASQTYKLLYACESCIEKEEKGDSNCVEQQLLLPETDIKCATLFIHMLSPCGQFSEEEVSGFFVKSNYQGYGWGDWRDECSKKFSN